MTVLQSVQFAKVLVMMRIGIISKTIWLCIVSVVREKNCYMTVSCIFFLRQNEIFNVNEFGQTILHLQRRRQHEVKIY